LRKKGSKCVLILFHVSRIYCINVTESTPPPPKKMFLLATALDLGLKSVKMKWKMLVPIYSVKYRKIFGTQLRCCPWSRVRKLWYFIGMFRSGAHQHPSPTPRVPRVVARTRVRVNCMRRWKIIIVVEFSAITILILWIPAFDGGGGDVARVTIISLWTGHRVRGAR